MGQMRNIIMLAVGLIIVAVIFPIALGLLGNAGTVIVDSTTNQTLADVIDPAVLTLLVILLPVIAIIAVIMSFLPGKGK